MSNQSKIIITALLTGSLCQTVYGKSICSAKEMDAAFQNMAAENKMIEQENVRKLKDIILQLLEAKNLDESRKSELLAHYAMGNPDYRMEEKQAIMQRIMTLLSQAGDENNPDCEKLTAAANMTGDLININREQWAGIISQAQRDLKAVRNAN